MFTHRSLWRRTPFTRVVLACLLASSAIALPRTAWGGQPPAGAPAIDAILKTLATYDGGIDSAAVWKLRDYVYARKDNPAARAECEAKLLQFLKSPATPPAKMAAARHLRIIAGDSAVPALQAMLSDARLADMALYALQQIPGGAADGALIQALKTLTGPTRIATLAALGERKTAAAVPAIAALLQQPAVAIPAAAALGRIGNGAAAAALIAVLSAAPAALQPAIASSVLSCAETALAARDAAGALRLYEAVSVTAALPVSIQRAALAGRIAASGNTAAALVLDVLAGKDQGMYPVAIARVSDLFAPDAIGPVCALLPRLPERNQVQLLAVLSGYPGERVMPTLLQAVTSVNEAVRIAAIKAMGTAGGTSAESPLAYAAARTRGAEQATARTALADLKGRAVDDAIVAHLAHKPPDEVAAELLLAVGARQIFPAKGMVLGGLASASPQIRSQSLKALRAIGTPSDVSPVLDLLLSTRDEGERADAEKTAVALARTFENADDRARMVSARLAGEKGIAARVRLIGVLGLVGDTSTLPAIRTLLDDESADIADAAARALAGWPSAAAREDLLRLARDARNETHRLLAIAGLVRVIGLEKYRRPQEAVADLRQAAGYSWRPEERRLVLGALAQFPCRDALDLAKGFLREPAVKAEAQAAIDQITLHLSTEASLK